MNDMTPTPRSIITRLCVLIVTTSGCENAPTVYREDTSTGGMTTGGSAWTTTESTSESAGAMTEVQPAEASAGSTVALGEDNTGGTTGTNGLGEADTGGTTGTNDDVDSESTSTSLTIDDEGTAGTTGLHDEDTHSTDDTTESTGTQTSSASSSETETETDSSTEASEDVFDCRGFEWREQNAAFTRRNRIRIDNSFADEPLEAFPVLVILDPSWFDYEAANADGSDLLIRSGDNASNLDYDIDVWNPHGHSYLWVRLPFISSSGSTQIFIYYENASALSQERAPSTFGRFLSVHHLGPDLRDVHGRADAAGATVAPDACLVENQCSPLIGHASTFWSEQRHIVELANEGLFDFSFRFTVTAWVRTMSLPVGGQGGWTPFVAKGEDAWRLHQFGRTGHPTLAVDCFVDGLCGAGFDPYGNWNAAQDGDPLVDINDHEWHHVAATLEPVGGDWEPITRPIVARVYVDGVPITERSFAAPEGATEVAYIGDGDLDWLPPDDPAYAPAMPVTIGGKYQLDETHYFDGSLDEVRISAEAMSPAWISAEHRIVAQNDVYILPSLSERCE